MTSVNWLVCVVVVVIVAAVDAVQKRANPCRTSSDGVLPNPKKCAQYFNCSSPGAGWQYCSYPQLFNPDTQRCEHHTMVKCGMRFEPLVKCEQRCTHPNCSEVYGPPCEYYSPSCRGKPDGLNQWNTRRGPPSIVICKNERVVYMGQCKSGMFNKERGCYRYGC